MARQPNYFYHGGGNFNPTPWAAAASSLGQALFGDQAEIDRRSAAAADLAYRNAATQQLELEVAEKQAQRDANEKLRKRFEAWASGRAMPDVGAPPAATPGISPTPMTPQGGLDASIFTDAPVDFQKPSQFPSPVPPSQIVSAPLPPLAGAPRTDAFLGPTAPTPVSNATPGYLANLSFHESRDNPTAQAPTSSASGAYQFIDKTWQGMGGTGRAADAPLTEQTARVGDFTDQNAALFQQQTGRVPTDVELYMLHQFGPQAGMRLANAPGNMPLRDIVGDAAMQANGYSPAMTKQDWLEPQMSEFGGQTWDGSLPAATAAAPAVASAAPMMATPAASGIDAGLFADQPAAPADPFDELLNDLNPFEIALLQTSPDFMTTFNGILEARAKDARDAAEAGGGLFAGTGIDAQMYNLYAALEEKRASGTPLTPQEQLQYNLATRHLMAPQTSITEGGIREVRPEALPQFGGATPGAAPGATPGAAPGATPAPGSLEGRVTSIEKPKPLPADVAGKLAMAESGITDLGSAINILAPKDEATGARTLDRGAVTTSQDWGVGGMPFTQGRQARESMMRGIETIIRIASGAAVPDTEMTRYSQMFIPSMMDSDAGAMAKLEAAERWMTKMQSNLAAGRGDMSLEEIANAAATEAASGAADPTAARKQELMNLNLDAITDPAELQRILDEMNSLGM